LSILPGGTPETTCATTRGASPFLPSERLASLSTIGNKVFVIFTKEDVDSAEAIDLTEEPIFTEY
jgi:hypothetical protein